MGTLAERVRDVAARDRWPRFKSQFPGNVEKWLNPLELLFLYLKNKLL